MNELVTDRKYKIYIYNFLNYRDQSKLRQLGNMSLHQFLFYSLVLLGKASFVPCRVKLLLYSLEKKHQRAEVTCSLLAKSPLPSSR